jgi:hypothetical protein
MQCFMLRASKSAFQCDQCMREGTMQKGPALLFPTTLLVLIPLVTNTRAHSLSLSHSLTHTHTHTQSISLTHPCLFQAITLPSVNMSPHDLPADTADTINSGHFERCGRLSLLSFTTSRTVTSASRRQTGR